MRNGCPNIILQLAICDPANPKSEETATVDLSAITDAIKQSVKEVVVDENRLLDYSELAQRLKLGIRATKDLVNCGKITPALRYANVARFHWPSVLQELKRHPLQ